MKAATKRKAGVKWDLWRRAVSFQSLQMMVMSGVVRRADLDPPQNHVRTGYWHRDAAKVAVPQEAASEQGWISRMILGRKSAQQSTHRL
ncbi:MAG: hypothetical protein H8K08_04695 [Nitrospira sp.]|nr:hypothetical protein [Nitrospira sp.]